MSHLSLTLVLRPRPRSELDLYAHSFDLELHNRGPEAVELERPGGWDLDLPERLEHSSDSQGELWVRAVGEPDPGEQRYSCSEAEAVPDPLRLEPGQRFAAVVGAPDLSPGDYEARVRLYQPALSSEIVRFSVS